MNQSDKQQQAQQKKAIRKQVRTLRKQLSQCEQHYAEEQLADRIMAKVKKTDAKKVALFFSMDGEIGTQLAIECLWQAKVEVYLPVIHPFNPHGLLFIRYQADTPLYRSALGMLEPKAECPAICPVSQLDILFTPLVAFDATGNRLGMGGGFYDRTLSHHYKQKATTPMVVGLAHACQQVPQVPVEPWDIPLKEIITDQQHFVFA